MVPHRALLPWRSLVVPSPYAGSWVSEMSSDIICTLRLNHGPALHEGVAFEHINTPTAPRAADATEQRILRIIAFPPQYFLRLRDVTPLQQLQQLQHGFSPWSFRSLAS